MIKKYHTSKVKGLFIIIKQQQQQQQQQVIQAKNWLLQTNITVPDVNKLTFNIRPPAL